MKPLNEVGLIVFGFSKVFMAFIREAVSTSLVTLLIVEPDTVFRKWPRLSALTFGDK